jgi:hypothetical protein
VAYTPSFEFKLYLTPNGANRMKKTTNMSIKKGVVHSDRNGLLSASIITNPDAVSQTPLSKDTLSETL